MTKWRSVYRTKDRIKAELAKDVLESHGITAVLINKQDSAYVLLGEFEIHVPVDEVMGAIKIVNDEIQTR